MKKKDRENFLEKNPSNLNLNRPLLLIHIFTTLCYVLWYCSKKKNIVKMLNRRKSCDEEI